eukprot:g31185.t1
MGVLSMLPAFSRGEKESTSSSAGDSCPLRCVCNSEATVDCSGVDLSTFPSNVSANTQHLALQNNRLEDIPIKHLSRLTKLKTLSLHNNRIPSQGRGHEGLKGL